MRGHHKLPLVLATALVGALLITGCGGDGGPKEPTADQQTAIDDTFAAYLEAVKDEDGAATCALIAPGSLEQLGGEEECAEVYGDLLKAQGKAFSTALEDSEIDRIEVADDDSIARMFFADTDAPPLRFQPSGDEWLIVPPDTLTGSTPVTE